MTNRSGMDNPQAVNVLPGRSCAIINLYSILTGRPLIIVILVTPNQELEHPWHDTDI